MLIPTLPFLYVYRSVSKTCWESPGQSTVSNESCHNDYNQSSVRILAEPEIRTRDLLFSSHLHYRLTYGGSVPLRKNFKRLDQSPILFVICKLFTLDRS